MKALQAFNGVYSGLLTTILYHWLTKSLPDKTISLTAYLISMGLDRPISFSIHKISYRSYNQRLLMYWWKYWHLQYWLENHTLRGKNRGTTNWDRRHSLPRYWYLWKLKQHCPYKRRPEFSNIQRMKALQAFNGVYSGLLTTILYYWQTKSLPDKTISLTAYLISIGLDRPIPFSIHKIFYKSYNQRLLMYWWKYWH